MRGHEKNKVEVEDGIEGDARARDNECEFALTSPNLPVSLSSSAHLQERRRRIQHRGGITRPRYPSEKSDAVRRGDSEQADQLPTDDIRTERRNSKGREDAEAGDRDFPHKIHYLAQAMEIVQQDRRATNHDRGSSCGQDAKQKGQRRRLTRDNHDDH